MKFCRLMQHTWCQIVTRVIYWIKFAIDETELVWNATEMYRELRCIVKCELCIRSERSSQIWTWILSVWTPFCTKYLNFYAKRWIDILHIMHSRFSGGWWIYFQPVICENMNFIKSSFRLHFQTSMLRFNFAINIQFTNGRRLKYFVFSSPNVVSVLDAAPQ